MTYKKQWEHGFKALYWGVTLYKTTEIANRIEFTNHSSETWPNVHTIHPNFCDISHFQYDLGQIVCSLGCLDDLILSFAVSGLKGRGFLVQHSI